ncbi:hypothetical protein [Aeromicrobium sp. CTD01-1L150]|uniref:hypothetical protein n=1 Tax=Aeromicrobium sp. CTD01-1L150 TaxID=3341830 RepID=UPI0035C0D52B
MTISGTEIADHRPARAAYMTAWCDQLETIIRGRDAAQLLEAGGLPARGAIAQLDVWVWRLAAIDVGRKDLVPGGNERLHMPVRVDHADGTVQVIGLGQKQDSTWTMSSLGHTGVGSIEVACSELVRSERTDTSGDDTPPSSVTYPPQSRQKISAELERIAEAGRLAEWQFRMNLEKFVDQCVHKAHRRVLADIFDEDVVALFDPIKLDQIRDRILFGDDENPGAVTRLIERCLRPSSFAKVDPVRYISSSLRRDAEDAVRKEIGDPRIGRALRRLAETVQPDSIDELVEAYNELNPNARISTKRAHDAMTITPDPMASWCQLLDETDDVEIDLR